MEHEIEPRYLNRELSWLDFNGRVLAQAEDREWPLLERAKFLAIFHSNLDEFFEIRVSGLQEQESVGVVATTPDGLTPREQLRAIRAVVDGFLARVRVLWSEDLAPALEKEGIRITGWDELDANDRDAMRALFEREIYPILTPLSVDPSHPFPFISTLSLNLAVVVRDPDDGEERFARVKVPPLLPRFLQLDEGERLVPIEQVISAFVGRLFPGMQVIECHAFRVTRDADVDLEEEEAGDLLDAIQSVLTYRDRSAHAVRLEVGSSMPDSIRDLLATELDLSEETVYSLDTPLDLTALWSVVDKQRTELLNDPWPPLTPPQLAEGTDVFATLRAGDVLLHHPYDSFDQSVDRFITAAAVDPQVVAIKQTLYRTSGEESTILRALSAAAQSGKQVVALVELKARGDEEANITWARMLERAGVHVVYGVVGLKTHAKLLLVVRSEPEGLRRYVHLATGNYNGATAKLYEDVGLLTSHPDFGADVADLFNYLTGYSAHPAYRKLLVAPDFLRARLTALIERESTPGGRIVLKTNALVDRDLIEALYAAGQAGASVDLIVRGICCLRAGVPGLSERIRVRSLVGRNLEHSRIYRFGEGAAAEYYIASADLMPRNLDRRVESAIPIEDPRLRRRLDEILVTCLEDDQLAWELLPDDTWRRVDPVTGVSAQRRQYELAVERTREHA